MALVNLATLLIVTGVLAYSTPGFSSAIGTVHEEQKGSEDITQKMDTGEQESNQTCGKLYKECLSDIDFEGAYVEVCNQTLLCSSVYFECRMKDNSTITEAPLEYPPVKTGN